MQKHWDISQDAFDKFLAWLDSDRERAGIKYEDIRQKLIRIFTCRGCESPEDLADDAINRVIRKTDELENTYTGDPILYFYGVARNVHHEHLRRTPQFIPLPIPESPEEKEHKDQCLELCMKTLLPENRSLVLEYYIKDGPAKIAHRRKIAEHLGISGLALRLRMHRIREILETCVETCLEQQA